MGELHHLRDEECILRGKIVAASAIQSAIMQYEGRVSQDQLERDLGLAFSLEACVSDYLRVIDEHAEEAKRMRYSWDDPAGSDDEYMLGYMLMTVPLIAINTHIRGLL